MTSERKKSASPFRIVALVIFFIIFVAFSFFVYEWMIKEGFPDWWEYMIPIGGVWLLYLGIAYAFVGK